ncbi:MAG TPA: methyltransferase domain-containing protein [Solirubrobacteraceae bacterium]|nr:methyltransferase domain-containing protein [Solirubrobacteraceae bacterium]
MSERRWYHTIDLGERGVTPGLIDLRAVAPRVLPPDLAGRRALDVGTFDGFWAFELERRGAEVVATDVERAHDAEWPPHRRDELRAAAERMGVDLDGGFRVAAEALGSRVRRVVCDVRRLDAEAIGGSVDVAFCGALLLHLRDPVGALERIRSVLAPGGTLVLLEPVAVRETLLSPRRPVARFEPLATPFNWWVANLAALRAWLRVAGFAAVRRRGFHRPPAREGMRQWHVALEAAPARGPAAGTAAAGARA